VPVRFAVSVNTTVADEARTTCNGTEVAFPYQAMADASSPLGLVPTSHDSAHFRSRSESLLIGLRYTFGDPWMR
jgi:hypothetical protein